MPRPLDRVLVSVLQVLEGQLEVLKVEVDQLGGQVDQAIQKWNLEELRRPYSHLSNLSQQLQHQAAVRWRSSPLRSSLYECSPVCQW